MIKNMNTQDKLYGQLQAALFLILTVGMSLQIEGGYNAAMQQAFFLGTITFSGKTTKNKASKAQYLRILTGTPEILADYLEKDTKIAAALSLTATGKDRVKEFNTKYPLASGGGPKTVTIDKAYLDKMQDEEVREAFKALEAAQKQDKTDKAIAAAAVNAYKAIMKKTNAKAVEGLKEFKTGKDAASLQVDIDNAIKTNLF